MENQRKNKLSEKRNKIIYQEFEKLFNNDGLRMDVIYSKLSEKWFLSTAMIGRIVVAQAKIIREQKEAQNKETIN
jgi:hypothetical protein